MRVAPETEKKRPIYSKANALEAYGKTAAEREKLSLPPSKQGKPGPNFRAGSLNFEASPLAQ